MEMANTGIILGRSYRDPITGFEGVATAVTYWLHGCARVGLECGVTNKDTDRISSVIEWFDTDRVKGYAVAGKDLTEDAIETKTTPISGGPMDSHDPGRPDPSR